MRWRRLAAVLGVALAVADARADEPTYADRPASWWVGELRSSASVRVATEVLRMMGPGAVEPLGAALADADPTLRRRAIRLLAEMHPDVARVLPRVAERLADDDAEVRVAAARIVGRLGPLATSAVPALRALLAAREAPGRIEALDALAAIGTRAAAAEPDLRRLLGEDRPAAERLAALRALAALGRLDGDSVVALVRAAGDADPRVASLAAGALALGGEGARSAVPALLALLRARPADRNVTGALVALGAWSAPGLVEVLDDPAPAVRRSALGTLLGVQWEHRRAFAARTVEALRERLDDPDEPEDRRPGWVEGLAAIAARHERGAAEALVAYLGDRNPLAAHQAQRAAAVIPECRPALLASLGAGPPAATLLALSALRQRAFVEAPTVEEDRAVARLLTNPERAVRVAAARALASGPRPVEEILQASEDRRAWVAVARDLLRSADPAERSGAPAVLAALRGAADAAIPLVVESLADPDPDVVVTAISAVLPLRGAGHRHALAAALVEATRAEEPRVRAAAAIALVRADPASPDVVGLLLPAFGAEEAWLRAAAAQTLAYLPRPPSPALLAPLAALTSDPDRAVSASAVSGLSAFAPDEAALDALRAALADRARPCRPWVPGALQPFGRAAVPVLAAHVADADETVARNAIAVLANMGTEAREALPALRAAEARAPDSLRGTLADAVRRLGPEPANREELDRARRDADPTVRRRAIESLGALVARDPSVAAWIAAALEDPDDVAAALAAKALEGREGEARSLAPGWIARVQGHEVDPRAERALAACAPAVGGDLARAWAGARGVAALRLLRVLHAAEPSALASAAPSLVPALVASVHDGAAPLVGRMIAGAVLARLAAVSPVAQQALARVPARGPGALPAAVLREIARARAGRPAPTAPRVLTDDERRLHHDTDPDVRYRAALAIVGPLVGPDEVDAGADPTEGNLAPEEPLAEAAAQALVAALWTGTEAVQARAAAKVGELPRRRPTRTLGPLEVALRHASLRVGRAAAHSIARIALFERWRPSGANVSLAAAEATTRAAAALALALCGEDPRPVVAAAIPLLTDEDARVRRTAIEALSALGPAAAEALPALERIARSSDAACAPAARLALGRIR